GVRGCVTSGSWQSPVPSGGGTLGSRGSDVSGAAKLSALVRSPQVARRHADRFGTSTPKRASMKRSREVWSKTSDDTKPPRLNGEMMSNGTRGPRPTGPATPWARAGNGSTVRYSPGVPGGAVGGVTWSKKPPFSSYVRKSTVCAQRSARAVSADTTWLTTYSPRTGVLCRGCSSCGVGAITHDTWGRLPAAASARKSVNTGVMPLAISTGSLWYCLKKSSVLSPSTKVLSAAEYCFQEMPRASSCSGIVVQLILGG